MSSEEYMELKAQQDRIEAMLIRLLDAKEERPAQDELVSLSDAAKACRVKKRWLLERVQDKDIPAYRAYENAPWKVFPADVRKYLTQKSNIKQVKPQSILKVLRVA